MAGYPGRRRWAQFGLRSLLLATVICAVAIAWWRQWKQSAEVAAMQEELQWLKSESEFQESINDVLRGLDLENRKHREAFKVLRYMNRGWPFNTAQRKPIGKGNDLEVFAFHSNSHSVPGSVDSVALLLRDQEVIDIVSRESYTRQEWHEVKLQDTDNDGSIEVVFDCTPGMWSDSKPFTIAYKASNTGFAKME